MYNNRLCIHMHFMYNSAGVGNLQSVLQLLGLQFWSAPAVLSTFGGPNVPLPSPCQRQDAHPHKELSESNPAPKSSSSYNQHFNNELSKGQKARDQNFLKQKYRLSLGNRTCWLRNFPSSIWLYANFVLVQPFALFQLSIACICILLLLICELPSGEWLTGWYIPPPIKICCPEFVGGKDINIRLKSFTHFLGVKLIEWRTAISEHSSSPDVYAKLQQDGTITALSHLWTPTTNIQKHQYKR